MSENIKIALRNVASMLIDDFERGIALIYPYKLMPCINCFDYFADYENHF